MSGHERSLVPPIRRDELPADCREAAALLNQGCVCRSVDHRKLKRALETGGVAHEALSSSHPHLFSHTQVYVAQAHLDFMAELIRAIERVVALPGWQARVLADAPAIARHVPSAASVFMGYDFHLGDDGPRLIEINTNAGGALLCAKLLHAQEACCASLPPSTGVAAEEVFVDMFRSEWRLARDDAPLTRIAIVDESPAAQFLAPEFELFRQLFEEAGIATLVVDPQEFSFANGGLYARGERIDLVYNRLTDFSLDEAQNAALRDAYLADAVVLTPHPRAHALYADKRNLVLLGDGDWLAEIGVGTADRQLLAAGVPATCEVTADNAAEFWSGRKQWFFKPAAGYGSKAAYRGDKLTRRVFEAIARGGYVAQALVPPSERHLTVDGVAHRHKLDLRNYVYRGDVQLVSARLYQGQTTNFRTPGGGFAAVFPVS
ncbi:MAG: hypothetical protein QM739_19590 [Propionivibrio sp.]